MADPREALGRLVREVWVNWAQEQPDAKPGWLTGWDDLDDGQREADMRIGAAVAAAERARIIRLADAWECPCGDSDCTAFEAVRDFAGQIGSDHA